MDYSFLKLYPSLTDALALGDFKTSQFSYATSIQLSPNETYSQITNVTGGIAFDNTYDVDIVNSCDESLKSITNNVFFEQFIDVNGDTQTKIEIVNIGQDFYGRAVMIRIKNTVGTDSWYTPPIKITDKNILQTIRFDYTNTLNLEGISYEEASNFVQSIRLYCEYSKPLNNSEAGQYYQISNKNTISTRFMRKIAHEFKCKTISEFAIGRLQKIFEHDTVYMDGIRVTDNPIVAYGDRIGYTDLLTCTFPVYRNEDDTFFYAYQIFTGLQYVSFAPIGAYAICYISSEGSITFNQNIELQTGTVAIYDSSDNSLIDTFTENDMSIIDNVLTISGFNNNITVNGNYYVNISEGLVSYLSVENEAIQDAVTWTFDIVTGMYNNTQYDSNDYLIGCPDDGIFSDEFGTEFS